MGSKTGRLAREQPAGRDHNKSRGNTPGHLLSANTLLSEELGRYGEPASKRGTSDSAASRLSVVTSKPARGHQPPPKSLTRVSTMINRRPGSGNLSLSLSLFLSLSLSLSGHRRHSRSQPPVTGQSSSNVETFQAGGKFRERGISRFFVPVSHVSRDSAKDRRINFHAAVSRLIYRLKRAYFSSSSSSSSSSFQCASSLTMPSVYAPVQLVVSSESRRVKFNFTIVYASLLELSSPRVNKRGELGRV